MASGGKDDQKKKNSGSGVDAGDVVLGAAAVGVGVAAVGGLIWRMNKLLSWSSDPEPEQSHSSNYPWDESKLQEPTFKGEYSEPSSSTGLLKMANPQEVVPDFFPDPNKPLAVNLEEYYSNIVTFDEEERKSAKMVVENIKNAARKFFKDKYPDKPLGDFHHKGSSYEGLKVISPNEFDITMPLKMRSHMWKIVEPSIQQPEGFLMVQRVNLKQFPIGNSPWDKFLVDNDVLSPAKVYRHFQSYVDIFLSEHSNVMDYHIKRSKTGPAITLNVKYGIGKSLDLAIDLVPEVELKDILLVAKQHPMMKCGGGEIYEYLWARSYSMKEKEIFQTIDAGNGCRRKCLKIIKAIFHFNKSQFKTLSSYHVKTIIMGMSEFEDWSQRCLAERFIDVLIALRNHLDERNLPHHFDSSVNLLGYINPIAMENVKGYLDRIIRGNKYIKLLETN